MAWTPKPEAEQAATKAGEYIIDADVADMVLAALLYGLRHSCSGPGMERILLGEEREKQHD